MNGYAAFPPAPEFDKAGIGKFSGLTAYTWMYKRPKVTIGFKEKE